VHLAGETAEALPLDPSNHVVIVEGLQQTQRAGVTVTVALWIERTQVEDPPVHPWRA
jgi:hypothetical protein